MIAEAVALAGASDHVVAVVGDVIPLVGEGRSTATLDLIGGQIALLDALAATGKPMTVVLIASKPLVLPTAARTAASVIWAASPGMRGGQAIAEILLGLVEPSGRLPVSFAVHVGQQPTYYNQVRGQHGNRYADLTQVPAWRFGHGLSYTTITYSDLVLAADRLTRTDTVRARVTLTNEGDRPSLETVQAYISDTVTSVSWADQELKAYRQVEVASGEAVTVEIEVPVADCTIVDAAGNRIVEAGAFELRVGPSSDPDRLLTAPFTVA
ncbi:glycoside hydrolase family 3 C-terminal domain-containing protein [Tessaracoccus coleopterorum]|uniref:glycoside hydrolase family 3 C-terminal domain-containing protein n=1 Tax=Tessaracoccus coleopterorum TaxID=2714950 RepID=UPI0018D426D2|nr:glycoside hydrolase family 3 C-terminal domain-containing protein [Tessaracoccus coleopterorum]